MVSLLSDYASSTYISLQSTERTEPGPKLQLPPKLLIDLIIFI